MFRLAFIVYQQWAGRKVVKKYPRQFGPSLNGTKGNNLLQFVFLLKYDRVGEGGKYVLLLMEERSFV